MLSTRVGPISLSYVLAAAFLVSISSSACSKENDADAEFVATDGKNSAIIYYVGVAAPQGGSLPLSGKTLACWYRSDVPNRKLANLARGATITEQQAYAAFFGPGARTLKLTTYPSSCTDFTRLSSRMLDGADYDGMCKTEFAASGPSSTPSVSALEGENADSVALIDVGNVLGGLSKFGQAATLIGSFSPNSSFGKSATSIGNGASSIGGALQQVGVVTSSVQSPAGTNPQAAQSSTGKAGGFLNLLLGMGLSRVTGQFAPLAQSAMQSTLKPSYNGLTFPTIDNPLSATDRSQLSTGFSLGNTLFGNRAGKAPAGTSLTDSHASLAEPLATASPRGGTEAHPEVSMSQLDALAAGAKTSVGTSEWVTLDGAAMKFPACPDL